MKSTRKINESPPDATLPPHARQRRRSRSRASASPGRGPLHKGLMNAAWPRSPKYRRVPANGQPFQASAPQWKEKDKISSLVDQVEDMEVHIIHVLHIMIYITEIGNTKDLLFIPLCIARSAFTA